MRYIPSTGLALLALATGLIAGCGDSLSNTIKSGSPAVATTTVTVTPSLGRIRNAHVLIRNARTNLVVGEAVTNTEGTIAVAIPKTVDAIVVEVSSDKGGTYFDEAKGDQNLPAGFTMRAASAITGNTDVGVTVLTEAAVQRAGDAAGGLTDPANITQANQAIGNAMGITDITRPPTPVGSATDLSALGTSDADRYALQLAGLAKVAAANSAGDTPAASLVSTLAADLKDTVIDGKSGSNPVTNPAYPTTPSIFQAAWQFGMTAIANTLTDNQAKTQLQTDLIAKTTVNDPVTGPVVTGSGDFGGDSKMPWKGQIYQLPVPTHSQPDFSQFTPTATLFTDRIDVPDRSFTQGFPGFPDLTANFGLVYSGPLTVAMEGDYKFRIGSDDGSILFIDGNPVINIGGDHAFYTSDAIVHLTAGVHTLRVEYYQGPPTELGLQLWVVAGDSTAHILTPQLTGDMAQPAQNAI